jgi:hypothetical protein
MYPKLYFSFSNSPATVLGFFNALLAPFVSSLVMLFALLAVMNIAQTDGIVESLAINVGIGGAVYFASMWLQPRARGEMSALFADLRATLRMRQG